MIKREQYIRKILKKLNISKQLINNIINKLNEISHKCNRHKINIKKMPFDNSILLFCNRCSLDILLRDMVKLPNELPAWIHSTLFYEIDDLNDKEKLIKDII